jgi:hypothetical protein
LFERETLSSKCFSRITCRVILEKLLNAKTVCFGVKVVLR